MAEKKLKGYYMVEGTGNEKGFVYISEDNWHNFKINLEKGLKEIGSMRIEYIPEAPYFVTVVANPDVEGIVNTTVQDSIDFQVMYSEPIGSVLYTEEDIKFDKHLLNRDELERVLEFFALHDKILFGAIYSTNHEVLFTTVNPECVKTSIKK